MQIYQQISQTFGINIYLLAAEIVNFLIVIYILKRFLYGPLYSMMKKREERIAQGLKDAEASSKALEDAKEEEKTIIKEAHTRAEKILADAKNEKFVILQEAQEQAKKQSSIQLQEAQGQIERERKEIESKVVAKMSNLLVEFIEKSTSDLFDKKEQQEVINRALKKFSTEFK